ncbi:MAG: HNH endonuclease [Promethearchaeota archaeon]
MSDNEPILMKIKYTKDEELVLVKEHLRKYPMCAWGIGNMKQNILFGADYALAIKGENKFISAIFIIEKVDETKRLIQNSEFGDERFYMDFGTNKLLNFAILISSIIPLENNELPKRDFKHIGSSTYIPQWEYIGDDPKFAFLKDKDLKPSIQNFPDMIQGVNWEFDDQLERNNYDITIIEERDKKQITMTINKRDAQFRQNVLQNYHFKCAVCGLSLKDTKGHYCLEACHILPVAEGRDDSEENGICLCRNHHWAFDNHLFSLSDDLTIIVDRRYHDTELGQYHNQTIQTPDIKPKLEYIQMHRKFIN